MLIRNKHVQKLRDLSPQLYDAILKARHSRIVRSIEGAGNRAAIKSELGRNATVGVDICGVMGFGATLTHAAIIQSFFTERNVEAYICSSNPLYTTDTDFFETYFLRKGIVCPDVVHRFRFDEDISLRPLDPYMTVDKAYSIFTERYSIKPVYIQEAMSFVSEINEPYISIHFRGSDKRLEAHRLDWGEIAATARRASSAFNTNKFFIATDEEAFIQFMQGEFGSDRIFTYHCEFMSDGMSGAHMQRGDPLQKGKEALLSILILSQGVACIRGSSHLSAWAKVLRPELPIIMLDKQIRGPREYLEREILAKSILI